VGGVVQLSVAVPIEVIKVVLQSQIPHQAPGQSSVTGLYLLSLYLLMCVLKCR